MLGQEDILPLTDTTYCIKKLKGVTYEKGYFIIPVVNDAF